MALRNQPYIPLYVQDFMTDEKLAECSAMATGVYIRIMCLMHKSTYYGKIMLKDRDKQDCLQGEDYSDKQVYYFACKLVKHLPYDIRTIYNGLIELIMEDVLYIDGDFLCQRRMIRDNEISDKRAISSKRRWIKNGDVSDINKKDVIKGGESNNDNEVKSSDEKNVNNSFNFRKSLIDYGFREDLVNDWLKVRKTKKATNTESAFRLFINEVEKTLSAFSGIDKNQILIVCIQNDWKVYRHQWFLNQKSYGKTNQATKSGVNRYNINEQWHRPDRPDYVE